MLHLENKGPMPHEFRSGNCRQPIDGREDNIPSCYPPITEHLTRERMQSGRVGHFTSRQPLLGLTADQEWSVPHPARSCTPMFPAPMPGHLYNHPRREIEHADWSMVEQPMLTTTANHVDYHNRVHQDRGNYHHPVNTESIGEPELTAKTPHMDFPFRPVPTKRAPIENRIGFSNATHQGNVARGGSYRESLVRSKKGGEYVNNRGGGAPSALTDTMVGVQRDTRPSLFTPFDVSGAPTALNQSNILIDPVTFHPRETNRIFAPTEASGAPSTVNQGPWRLDAGLIMDRHPVDSTIDTHVSFGPDLRHDFAADRFQKVRTHVFDHRAEIKSGATNEIDNKGAPSYFDRPIIYEGRDHRVTDRDSLLEVGRADAGENVDALRQNPHYNEPHHFYAKKHASKKHRSRTNRYHHQ